MAILFRVARLVGLRIACLVALVAATLAEMTHSNRTDNLRKGIDTYARNVTSQSRLPLFYKVHSDLKRRSTMPSAKNRLRQWPRKKFFDIVLHGWTFQLLHNVNLDFSLALLTGFQVLFQILIYKWVWNIFMKILKIDKTRYFLLVISAHNVYINKTWLGTFVQFILTFISYADN